MTEEEAIQRRADPVTVRSLVDDFRDLGVRAGDTLLVHSSMSSLGWVVGGPPAVIEALQEVLTSAGTLVMPTHSSQYTDPEGWTNPPVPDEWVEIIRRERPPYRPDVTPTRGMGAIPECFRTYPGVIRSRHPTVSFAAWGADAEDIVSDHGFDYGLGEHSPVARVYELDGDVLLLGVGHERNTSLHLAEYRAEIELETMVNATPVRDQEGEHVTIEYEDIETCSDDFADLGAAFEREVGLSESSVGAATAKLSPQRALVDYAVDWVEANR